MVWNILFWDPFTLLKITEGPKELLFMWITSIDPIGNRRILKAVINLLENTNNKAIKY